MDIQTIAAAIGGIVVGAIAVVLVDDRVYQQGATRGFTDGARHGYNGGYRDGWLRGARCGVQSVVSDLLGVRPAGKGNEDRPSGSGRPSGHVYP